MNNKLRTIAWMVGLIAPALVAITDAQASGPKRPDEAFTVYVTSELEDTEDYSADKVKKEVVNRIKKQKDWFIVAKTPEKAELFVEVVRHTVEEQMRHKMVARVNRAGNGKDYVTETWTQEQHVLEVRVEYFGAQKLVRGEDARESGGSLKRAAEHLAENLESMCRENYQELSTLRRATPSSDQSKR